MIERLRLACRVVSAFIICGMGLCLSPVQGADKPWEPTGKETPASMKARTSAINRPQEVGKYYEATVPDTLDLAERAWLGINFFTSITSEKDDYEMYWRADFDEGGLWAWPGHMVFQMATLMICQPKALEAMARERLMSGSQQNLEREAKMMEMMASHLLDDGLYYIVPSGGRNPWLGLDDVRPYANPHAQGRMMRAMIAWYQYTGDPKWKERIDRMVDGLDKVMVVHKEDYAYVPFHSFLVEGYMGSCYVKGRGWKATEGPKNEKEGEEGSLFNGQGNIPGALATWYTLTGNKQALRLSGELVRFLTKPKFWADWKGEEYAGYPGKGGEYPGVVGAEHAHWTGHYHGHVNTLRAILEYAMAVNDARLKQFVRDGYEWTRTYNNFSRIGLFAEGEGCGCARMLGLAVKLTDAGVGDYWEDVDLYIRNHGSEMQLTPDDIPHLQKLLKKNPNPAPPPDFYAYQHETVRQRISQPERTLEGTVIPRAYGTDVGVLEASIGAFAMNQKSGWAMCCAHGNMGLFYPWDGTLRCADGVARINLLLNRASPWMDIDSYIPYEGKVVLRNKTAREAFVRIPLYVDTRAVICRIGNQAVLPKWFERYLWIGGLKAGDVVTIEFPLEERIERWGGHTFRFRGNTVIEFSPPLRPGFWVYPDRSEKYKLAKAPMKKVVRYVTNQMFQW